MFVWKLVEVSNLSLTQNHPIDPTGQASNRLLFLRPPTSTIAYVFDICALDEDYKYYNDMFEVRWFVARVIKQN